MLSGETSVGEYPIETVRDDGPDHRVHRATTGCSNMAAIDWQPKTKGGIIAKAAAEVAERVGAKYLVAFTQSGDSARRLSRYRGPIPVLAFTPEATVRSQLAMTWGVETFKTEMVEHTDEMVRQVDEALLEDRAGQGGRPGRHHRRRPPGIPGSTNALRIHRMGDAINEVAPAYRRQLSPSASTNADGSGWSSGRLQNHGVGDRLCEAADPGGDLVSHGCRLLAGLLGVDVTRSAAGTARPASGQRRGGRALAVPPTASVTLSTQDAVGQLAGELDGRRATGADRRRAAAGWAGQSSATSSSCTSAAVDGHGRPVRQGRHGGDMLAQQRHRRLRPRAPTWAIQSWTPCPSGHGEPSGPQPSERSRSPSRARAGLRSGTGSSPTAHDAAAPASDRAAAVRWSDLARAKQSSQSPQCVDAASVGLIDDPPSSSGRGLRDEGRMPRVHVPWSEALTSTTGCPGWDSNPHWTVFETAILCRWDTGACAAQTVPEQTGRAGTWVKPINPLQLHHLRRVEHGRTSCGSPGS